MGKGIEIEPRGLHQTMASIDLHPSSTIRTEVPQAVVVVISVLFTSVFFHRECTSLCLSLCGVLPLLMRCKMDSAARGAPLRGPQGKGKDNLAA